jgi:hypothetical protein
MRTTVAILITLLLTLACGGGDQPEPALSEGDAPEVAAPSPPADEPTAAPAAVSEPEKGWMVIVAGDKDEAVAKEKYRAFDESGPSVGNFPATFLSDDVEGLNAGFHIVVAGIPRDKATAEQMAKALGKKWEGTYIREVTVIGVEDVSCDFDPRCAGAGWMVLIVFDNFGNRSEDWAAFTDEVVERAKKAGIDAKWDNGEYLQPVMVDGKKVAEVDIQPFIGELFGYVFAKEGAEPQYQEHAMPDDVLHTAQAYFKVEIE